MADTRIEWADVVWNPVTGCTPMPPGCDNCYAARMAPRLAGRFGYDKEDPFRPTFHEDRLEEPARWRKPRRVFVCSMGDLFHGKISDAQVLAVFQAMGRRRGAGHVFHVLTKRPERMRDLVLRWIEDGVTFHEGCTGRLPWYVWLGVSVERQVEADHRIPYLLETPAFRHFVSVEPMLREMTLARWVPNRQRLARECAGAVECEHGHDVCPECDPVGLDWVVAGGETGPRARPAHPDWFRRLRDECVAAGVPFFLKSRGVWLPWDPSKPVRGVVHVGRDGAVGQDPTGLSVPMVKTGKAGAALDGREWREVPIGSPGLRVAK